VIFARRDLTGTQVEMASRNRQSAPTAEQVRAQRHALWLHGYEVGLPDPFTGRNRPRKRRELAELWGVTVETIRCGLKSARDQRNRFQRVSDG
jgi:hypothetical protein